MRRPVNVALVTSLLLAAAVCQAAGPLDIDAGVGVHSKYVWRGIVVTPDAVVQPEASLGLLGMRFGVWGNVDTSDANGTEWELNEVDWTFGYTMDLPLFSCGAGLIHYDLRGGLGADTSELYVNGRANVLLSPGLDIFFDLDEFKGTHVRASAAHGGELGEFLEWDVAAELGWGSEGYVNGYFPSAGTSAAGFTDALLSLGLPWHPAPLVTVTPHVSYAVLLGDARDAGTAPQDATFLGITAMFSF
jgi:hypothetical protein